jgi:hypothetical protein
MAFLVQTTSMFLFVIGMKVLEMVSHVGEVELRTLLRLAGPLLEEDNLCCSAWLLAEGTALVVEPGGSVASTVDTLWWLRLLLMDRSK